MKLRPVRDAVIIKQDEPKDKVGSLYVPQGKETFDDFGTVIAVGPDVKDVKEGDRVIFIRRPSSHIGEGWPEMKGYLRLKEEDVVAVIEW